MANYTTELDLLKAVAASDGNSDQLNVTVASSGLPAGAATSAKQDTGNTSLNSIDTKTPALGQAVMASSTPVVIASNQSTINIQQQTITSATTTLTGAGTALVSTNGMGTVRVTISGSWTGSIQFECSVDGTNFDACNGVDLIALTNQVPSSTSANGRWAFDVSGTQSFRLRGNTVTNTANVQVSASPEASVINAVLSNSYVNQSGTWSTTGLSDVAQASTTSGQSGALVQGACTTAAPTYVTAKTNPLSLNTSGELRAVLSTNSSLAANQSVNVAQINGVTPLMGAGNTGTGSHRMTIATDQAILTNAWKSNTAQINGAAPLMGNGVTGTGSQRVTLASDTSSNTNPFLTNQSQINSVALLAGNGVTGTGSQRVTIASDNTAFSVNAVQSGTWTVQPGNTANTTPWLVAATDGTKTSYSASALGIASAVAATDIFTITGSGTKTIRVTKIAVSGTQTTAGDIDVQVIKRSMANSSGTSTSATAVPHDSNDAAGTATVLSYTVNPTLGSTVGTIRCAKVFIPAVLTASIPSVLEYDFGVGPQKTIVLRGTSQVLAINLNGATVTGGSFNFFVEWTEE